MAGNGALDLSIRIMGKVDPSLVTAIKQTKGLTGDLASALTGTKSLGSTVANTLGVIGKTGLGIMATLTTASAVMIKKTTSMAEEWVQILDAVFRERRKKELEAAERLKIYTDIDRADEAVLDILAVQFRVDWYDTSYPIETKRRIIKTALEVRRYCGTEWAVQKALSSIYPNVKISEWYDYGGRPGYWRMNVDITDDGAIYYTPEEIEKRLGYARRCTAHLEHIIYIVEPHERSPAYIAAAPCGMATSCTVKVPGRIKPREIGAKAYVAGAVGRSKMQVAVALPGAVEAKAVKARAFTAGTVERSHTAINIVIGGQTT